MNKIEELEQTIKKVQEQIEELKQAEKKCKRCKPEMNEKYYYIGSDGTVGSYRYDNDKYDNRHYNLRNMFKTFEEAQFEAEKRKLLCKLQDIADENPVDWNDDGSSRKFFIYYDYNCDRLKYGDCLGYRDLHQMYYSSEEIVKQVIEDCGDDIIKYLIKGYNQK